MPRETCTSTDLATPDRCAVCGYNLAGLTTNTCPECGRDTVLEAAKRWARRQTWLHWSLFAVGGLVACCVISWMPHPLFPGASAAGAVCFVALLAIAAHWFTPAAAHSVDACHIALVAIAPPVATTLAWFGCAQISFPIRLVHYAIAHAVAAGMLTIFWSFVPRRRSWAIVCSFGGLCLTGAGALFVHALGHLAARNFSTWFTSASDLLTYQPSLHCDALLPLSVPYLMAGLIIVLMGLTLRPLARRSA